MTKKYLTELAQELRQEKRELEIALRGSNRKLEEALRKRPDVTVNGKPSKWAKELINSYVKELLGSLFVDLDELSGRLVIGGKTYQYSISKK